MAALMAAYPSQLRSASGNTIVWKDGTTMQYDDGKAGKTFEEMLNDPDLKDQMSMDYPVNAPVTFRPGKDFDPGRIRYDPFFKKMYGASRKDVEKNLTVIRWMPKTVNVPIRVTTVNDVHLRLQRVSNELDQLPDRLKRYVRTLSGSYVWRTIAGTERPSMHSFGIAIDINARNANYWRWDTPDRKGEFAYKNKIPREIVAIFEKHGFIWGGRWYHYDTMHFEYRPELLIRRPPEQ
jgi:peptidoglycan L-alanyl-D-glutamate endopeptidase CwlK